MKYQKLLFGVALFLVFSVAPAIAFMSIVLDDPYSGITSNSVIDIAFDGTGVWLGTGGGASYSSDGGSTWLTYNNRSGLPSEQVSALGASLHLGVPHVWVGTSHTEKVQGSSYPFGDGLVRTLNHGVTWDTIRYPQQGVGYGKLSYDIEVFRGHVYSACFYGGLIRSTNGGLAWENLFLNSSDSLDLYNENYVSYTNRYFSVKIDTTDLPDTISLWAGSAYGINRFIFTNYGNPALKQDTAWQLYFNPNDTVPLDHRLPGNFVVSLGVNKIDTTTYLWAACRPGYGAAGQDYAVAYSSDNGIHWTKSLSKPAWDIAFLGDTTFVAFGDERISERGYGLAIGVRDSLTGDYLNWRYITSAVDTSGMRRYFESPFYCVEIINNEIWAGGADGVIKSSDFGNSWSVFRSTLYADDHYAYPSPFSPYTSTRRGSTIHYRSPSNATVTIKIYDFNLDLVNLLVSDQPCLAGQEYDNDIWDGRNDKGVIVANGVYFYNIKFSTGEDWWGKVVVIK